MSLESEYRLSKGAQRLVAEAKGNGVNPEPYVEMAVKAKGEAGRPGIKVGKFGPCAEIFRSLEQVIFDAKNRLRGG